MAIKANPLIATAHALGTFFLGLRCLRFRNPEPVVYVMGYIVASEPLWRVGKALIFYESAKYSIAGLSIVALLRYRTLQRADFSALIYFVLLLPSLLVLPDFDRRLISFNLSGPFALATTALFLSSLRLPAWVLKKLFVVILAPTVGFAFVASYSTFTTEAINFFSTKVAAGGLGNNQASSALGLGALVAFAYVCIARRPRFFRWCIAGAGLWCALQGALTFSRGGVATALGAMAVMSVLLLRDRRFRGVVVLRVGLIALIAVYVAVPFLNTVTRGGFAVRFTDTDLTGRDRIAKSEISAFQDHPLFGVGPGGSKDYHERIYSRRYSPHTEYSRLLAEHGLFGLAAIVFLAWMAAKRLISFSSPVGKAIAASFTVWALLFMFHAAMRMGSASFIFALGAAHLMSDEGGRSRARRRFGREASRPPFPGPGRGLPPAASPAAAAGAHRTRTPEPTY